MGRRVAKLPSLCKKMAFFSLLSLIANGAVAVPPMPAEPTLRDCVRRATSAAAITACESQARGVLETRVTTLTESIRHRLSGTRLAALERNVAAWEAFVVEEKRLIELIIAPRRDGLGKQLQAGAINQLLEQRVTQLRTYLHSLSN